MGKSPFVVVLFVTLPVMIGRRGCRALSVPFGGLALWNARIENNLDVSYVDAHGHLGPPIGGPGGRPSPTTIRVGRLDGWADGAL